MLWIHSIYHNLVDITIALPRWLRKGKIKDRLFDHDSRLQTLEQETEACYKEWSRLTYRAWVLNDASSSQEVPMEVDAVWVQGAEQNKKIKIKTFQLGQHVN